jgi:hypothetical protein
MGISRRFDLPWQYRSGSGCYIQADVEGAREGLEGMLRVEIMGHKTQLTALII